jgi:hypothetical protein
MILFIMMAILAICAGFRPLSRPIQSSTQLYYSRWPAPEDRDKKVQSVAQQTEDRLDSLYESSFNIKCPFFRRRAFDTLEALKSVFYFVVARHKSTPLSGSFFPATQDGPHGSTAKSPLPLDRLASVLHRDWMGRGLICDGKGYYVTGRLTKQVLNM